MNPAQQQAAKDIGEVIPLRDSNSFVTSNKSQASASQIQRSKSLSRLALMAPVVPGGQVSPVGQASIVHRPPALSNPWIQEPLLALTNVAHADAPLANGPLQPPVGVQTQLSVGVQSQPPAGVQTQPSVGAQSQTAVGLQQQMPNPSEAQPTVRPPAAQAQTARAPTSVKSMIERMQNMRSTGDENSEGKAARKGRESGDAEGKGRKGGTAKGKGGPAKGSGAKAKGKRTKVFKRPAAIKTKATQVASKSTATAKKALKRPAACASKPRSIHVESSIKSVLARTGLDEYPRTKSFKYSTAAGMKKAKTDAAVWLRTMGV